MPNALILNGIMAVFQKRKPFLKCLLCV